MQNVKCKIQNAGLADEPLILATLQARFFELAARENYPHTPEITGAADRLQAVIRARSQHIEQSGESNQ